MAHTTKIPNEKEVAASLETTPEVLPFIPELLTDLWELGSFPERIVEILRMVKLPPKTTRVLDLGCGKGAVSITLAKELGFQCLGIDAFAPFLKAAEKIAAEKGFSGMCRFEFGDIREAVKTARNFDVVVLASVGSPWGMLDQTVGTLRRTVRPGGYLLIDEGFLAESAKNDQANYEYLVPHGLALKQLTAHGDRLLREVIIPTAELQAMNNRYTELIRQRAAQLTKRHPEAADLLWEYVQNQERECEILESTYVGAIWLLQIE